jgi:cysteine desulfurase/selenocysteine lyase
VNERIRADFPLLQRKLDGKPVVYLDSGATALKPRAVLDAERLYGTDLTANVHRGKHALSEEASAAFERARRRIARFVGADPECVIFTRNTTESLNLVAAGLKLSREDKVLVPVGEHHSNFVPWLHHATLVPLDADVTQPLDPAQVAAAIAQHRPKVLALSLASNVSGVVHPVADVCRRARAAGVLTVVDAAQGAPHLPIDLAALDCDFLAFSGHKVLGPTGIGVLTGRAEQLERLVPLNVGGGTVDRVTRTGFTLKRLPHRLEAGTPHISGVLGLEAAVDYLEGVGFDVLEKHERRLADVLEQTLADLPGARVVMARAAPRLAIACVAPLAARVSPDHLARALSDGHQVLVRSGFFCAHPAFDQLGLGAGAVRASAYLYNTEEEVLRFGAALRGLLERLVSR